MNFMQKPINIVKNLSDKLSLTFIMSLIIREASKGEIAFRYDCFVTNKSYKDYKRIFTVFDAENILPKFSTHTHTFQNAFPPLTKFRSNFVGCLNDSS